MTAVGPPKLAHHRLTAKIKWVRDPFLDSAVARERDLRPAVSLHRRIPSPSGLPLSQIPSLKFFQKYPSLFTVFTPGPGLPPRVRLTRRALSLRYDDASSLASPPLRSDAAARLSRLLLLGRSAHAPIRLIRRLAWDLGLPDDFAATLVPDFPDLFSVCQLGSPGELGLEIVPPAIAKRLPAAELERRAASEGKKTPAFPASLPLGFALPKKAEVWLRRWEALAYMSPYESGVHLSPASEQAEKWAAAVVHELLWLTVSKKAERESLAGFGEWVGIGRPTMKKALVRHPEIFYVSNKLRTQTVVLREAYRKDFLLHKHPLMSIRYRYISLLNSRPRRTGS